MALIKQITTKRLNEILATVNTNTIKEIEVFTGDWSTVVIGYHIYKIITFDMDPMYDEAAKNQFMSIINDFKNELNIKIDSY